MMYDTGHQTTPGQHLQNKQTTGQLDKVCAAQHHVTCSWTTASLVLNTVVQGGADMQLCHHDHTAALHNATCM